MLMEGIQENSTQTQACSQLSSLSVFNLILSHFLTIRNSKITLLDLSKHSLIPGISRYYHLIYSKCPVGKQQFSTF